MLFIVLFIGPVIVRKYINNLPNIPLNLQQPTGQNNNDTRTTYTGSLLNGLGGAAGGATGGGGGGGGGGSAATTGGGGGGGSGNAFASTAFGLGGGGGRFVRW